MSDAVARGRRWRVRARGATLNTTSISSYVLGSTAARVGSIVSIDGGSNILYEFTPSSSVSLMSPCSARLVACVRLPNSPSPTGGARQSSDHPVVNMAAFLSSPVGAHCPGDPLHPQQPLSGAGVCQQHQHHADMASIHMGGWSPPGSARYAAPMSPPPALRPPQATEHGGCPGAGQVPLQGHKWISPHTQFRSC